MKITQTASFWVVVWSALVGLLVGQIHWILGIIFFLVLAGKAMFTALMIDTAYGVVEYHNDRGDVRKKKEMESELYMKQLEQKWNTTTRSK